MQPHHRQRTSNEVVQLAVESSTTQETLAVAQAPAANHLPVPPLAIAPVPPKTPEKPRGSYADIAKATLKRIHSPASQSVPVDDGTVKPSSTVTSPHSKIPRRDDKGLLYF